MIEYVLDVIIVGLLLFDNVRLRRERHKRALADAETVARALSNSIVVDGVELPKPEDTRWVYQSAKYHDGKAAYILAFGSVRIDLIGRVYVGDQNHMTFTKNTKTYCDDVWKAYRSRVARKAIESTS